MKKKSLCRFLSVTLLSFASLVQVDCLFGQSSIAHFKGPSFPVLGGGTQLDMNVDGMPDYIFYTGRGWCTENPFMNVCEFSYEIGTGTNELLATDFALVQPFGTWIDAISPEGAAWIEARPLFTPERLATYHSGFDWPEPYWRGTLGVQGIGYLGVRFYAADGLHYGWIRVRLPAPYPNQTSPEYSPVVTEWAYETRPNTAIRAGDTGEQRTELRVNFLTSIQGQDYSTGRVWVGRDSLSYEIRLAGGELPTGLTIEPSQSNRKPLANIDFPYIPVRIPSVLQLDFTLLFGEISIPPGQAIQLRRGRYYLKHDGIVTAEIVPISP